MSGIEEIFACGDAFREIAGESRMLYKKLPQKTICDMSEPLVSVIVLTKNSGEFLDACLKSIKDQTYKFDLRITLCAI